jgi:SAM-dependent methyltransferase
MTAEFLQEHRHLWQQKPVLRLLYQDYYERICEKTVPGSTLEIGGGSGNLKEYLPNVISTDIVSTSWLDVSCDAQALPFSNASFDNIIGMDVLHHIERPIRFLREAERSLKPGGRLILVEPAITPVSWVFYHFFHPEPVVFKCSPLDNGPLDPKRDPFDANQAIPSLLANQYRQAMNQEIPQLTLTSVAYISLWAYPLSGGFRSWCLIPQRFARPLLNFEKKIEKLLGRLLGFRLFMIWEKQG